MRHKWRVCVIPKWPYLHTKNMNSLSWLRNAGSYFAESYCKGESWFEICILLLLYYQRRETLVFIKKRPRRDTNGVGEDEVTNGAKQKARHKGVIFSIQCLALLCFLLTRIKKQRFKNSRGPPLQKFRKFLTSQFFLASPADSSCPLRARESRPALRSAVSIWDRRNIAQRSAACELFNERLLKWLNIYMFST